ncbi:THAP domain-containing protein 3 [Elysia marginata]|uniref:THAP domain-containing protein 3 n=1 Tax=Elysia marginata TaxID=1093978 RepID=A0AAV4FKG1_9GAST|nr:THAP domain-containing protein 3 [Elysia marginata]
MPGGGKICAAYDCNNGDNNKDLKGKVSFYAFPFRWGKDYVKAWKIRLKRQDFEPTTNMVVCSEHFEESCFEYQNFTVMDLGQVQTEVRRLMVVPKLQSPGFLHERRPGLNLPDCQTRQDLQKYLRPVDFSCLFLIVHIVQQMCDRTNELC